MYVQGCLKREQERVKRLLLEKDRKIQKQNSSPETADKKNMKKETQQRPKIERLATTCNNQQISQCSTDNKKAPNSNSPGNSGSTTSLDRHRPGAARLHGSFRQYKKDREKSRLLQQNSLQASNPNISTELNVLDKEFNSNKYDLNREIADLSSSSLSSSPTTPPRQQAMVRANNHTPLRQTRSYSGVTNNHLALDPKYNTSNIDSNSINSPSHGKVSLSVSDKGMYHSSTFPRKGILKATSSYNGSSTVTISMNNKNNTILENFSQIENHSLDQKNDFNSSRSIIESLKKAELNEKLVISTALAPITSETNRKSNQNMNIDKSKSIAVGKGEKSDSGRESDECPSSTPDQSLDSTSDDGLSWQSLAIVEPSQNMFQANSVDTKDILKSETSIDMVERHRYKHRSSLTSSCSSANSSFDATYDSSLSLSKDSNTSTSSDSCILDPVSVSPKGTTNHNVALAKETTESIKVNAFHRDTTNGPSVSSSIRKKKPMPPPRSSMTRLTTIKSREIAQTTKVVKQPNDKIDGIRQKSLVLPDKPIIHSQSSKVNVTSTPKAESPPDPLRSLKQSPLYCKIVQESAECKPSPNEHKGNKETLLQNRSAENVSDTASGVKKPPMKAPDGPSTTKSSVIQAELPAITIPSTNLNNNKESNKGSKIVPKSILHTNTHNDAAQALDLLIHTNTINEFNLSSRKSSKRVKFHPEVKLSKEKEIHLRKDSTISQKDEKSNDDKGESKTKTSDNTLHLDAQRKYIKPKKNEDISYYEPYV